ncbi:cytochrome b/b6 domain-containing protein [Anaeromyxobacter paludicola]|uniref:Cytochrome b561 bacterial/Ni-hydrogenase domain-containing protein n=1 Tax=Anaeromyxobacter paludicola TaxID=2918171 RepID=A0ABN6N7W1_9BACT|nr:cytochrome b/b6 domain-containing protein [Anaeromyxobacter paludicola]BDG09274.1 hypothetical protein AMPC_23870 [Anaeromyxobacter paludicola]
MRPTLIAIVLCLSAAAAPARAGEAKKSDNQLSADAQACLGCHAEAQGTDKPAIDAKAFLGSVHAGIADCTDCHQGYKPDGMHSEGLPQLTGPDADRVAKLAAARRPGEPKPTGERGPGEPVTVSPRAFVACGNCHSEVADQYWGSVHAKSILEPGKVAGATCVSCHGAIHAVQPLVAKDAKGHRPQGDASMRALATRCEKCHANEEYAKAAGLNPEVGVTYRDSIHGRQVAVGNPRAPNCSDCHGGHGILAKADPASTVAGHNRALTCGKCHPGANDTFASVIAHRELQEDPRSPIPHYVHLAFSWLTTLTLLFFGFHVLIDFLWEIRRRLSRKAGHHVEPELAEKTVKRFDIHQRIQHWLLLSGCILLGLTGWPLRGAGYLEKPEALESSRKALALFGGAHAAGLWHRFAAVLLIVSGVYHVLYLAFLAQKRALPFSMLPMPKDALDIRDNILHMLGLKKERPRFERFNYMEKFDYWAVFWGCAMMIGTGFIFWFPVTFAKFLPHWALSVAQIIHGEEATLAILFLFVVHFYNVHLRPSIFPMNWTWLTGETTLEFMKDEHPLEYEKAEEKKELP